MSGEDSAMVCNQLLLWGCTEISSGMILGLIQYIAANESVLHP